MKDRDEIALAFHGVEYKQLTRREQSNVRVFLMFLEQTIREAKAEAWDEGHAAGQDYQGDGWNADTHDPADDNPYREGRG